jgi:hypothetical protein
MLFCQVWSSGSQITDGFWIIQCLMVVFLTQIFNGYFVIFAERTLFVKHDRERLVWTKQFGLYSSERIVSKEEVCVRFVFSNCFTLSSFCFAV